MKIVLVPSGFKESLNAEQVAKSMKEGIFRALPNAEVVSIPLVDGGEGFVETMVKWTGGTLEALTVTGPVLQKVSALFGFLGSAPKKTAVIEIAQAAGLKLVPKNQRNPLCTTSYGVGEMIRAALDLGAERILVGCGDSGINDGGIGMAQALGVRFFDKDGSVIDARQGASVLPAIASIDIAARDPRLENVPMDVACNWHNVLCGPNGVARVFGPQKGASPEQIEVLENGIQHFAEMIEEASGLRVQDIPGGGASGGLGAGFNGLLGAILHPRYEVILKYLDIDHHLQQADLVFTAEGSIDFQTPRGKIPAEVASRAKSYGKPVIVIAGTIGKGANINYRHGIDVFMSILQTPSSLEAAMEKTEKWICECAEGSMRTVLVGLSLAETLEQHRDGKVS
ncbi:glycerate kinase family protein [Shouchella patagoniensis]|uniref:glycerate kinase family protein n=1 Tax=Shouchella patagoniensis TaxID=228576 RepID=UPI000995A728|nr:glycerate kinase [Shouchella patagoniensis]